MGSPRPHLLSDLGSCLSHLWRDVGPPPLTSAPGLSSPSPHPHRRLAPSLPAPGADDIYSIAEALALFTGAPTERISLDRTSEEVWRLQRVERLGWFAAPVAMLDAYNARDAYTAYNASYPYDACMYLILIMLMMLHMPDAICLYAMRVMGVPLLSTL